MKNIKMTQTLRVLEELFRHAEDGGADARKIARKLHLSRQTVQREVWRLRDICGEDIRSEKPAKGMLTRYRIIY